MARIAGITVIKDYRGTPQSITFNYRKYGDVLRSAFLDRGLEFPVVGGSFYNKKEVQRLLSIREEMKSGMVHEVDVSNFWDE